MRMNYRVPIALPLTLLAAAVFLSPLPAQVRGVRAAAPAPRTGGAFRAGARTGFGQRGFFPGWGWAYLPPYYPDYYCDYQPNCDYGYESTQAPPPWAFVQPSQPPAPAAKPIEPLVLERQGDQWVRISGEGQSPAAAQSTAANAGQAPNPPSGADRNKAEQPAPKLPPAVLVFRDGHKEEIERYAIIGPVIYTRADYWSTGAWTKKVAIADLDVPATLKLNRERGGKFTLPSGPNEVVVRP